MTEVGAATPLDFLEAVLTPAFHEDPYPWYADLRAREPVHEAGLGVLVLSRHADVARVVRDPALSVDERSSAIFGDVANRGIEAVAGEEARPLLFLDPPDHTRLRGLVSQAFTPTRVAALRGRIEQLVDGLLDHVADDGACDLVTAYAYPLPVTVICELLGVPRADEARFHEWSQALTKSIEPGPLRGPEIEAQIQAAREAMAEYVLALAAARRRDPGDDLLSALVAVEAAGDRLHEPELVAIVVLLLVAGHETTVNLVSNGVLALLRNPDQLARLRDDPTLERNTVEEALRYDSPVQATQRITLADYELGDRVVPRGHHLIALLGAANHDPEVFDDPERFDIGRAGAARHVSFGGGAHFCLGAPLARIEAEVAIGAIVRRFPHLALAGEPTRRAAFTLRGLVSLPISVR